MKKIVPIIIFICFSTLLSALETQYDLNRSAIHELKTVQFQLNECCNKIRNKHKENGAFIEKFNASQKAWEKYCNDYLDALYPSKNKQRAYGSIFPVIYTTDKIRLIKRRIEDLSPWFYKIEGDCGNSFLTYEELRKRNFLKNYANKNIIYIMMNKYLLKT